ncbi:MAG: MFS transporter [Oscillospiraceae bacterium]|nr:MFS transporter [Oscillospiraceae bacterium]
MAAHETPPAEAPALKTYGKTEMRLYLTGLAGQNIVFNVFNALFAHFAQFVLTVPAMTVSVIMTVARVWDGFNDPIMGTIVDRTRSKWGKCRPYLLLSPLPIFFVVSLSFLSFGGYDAADPRAPRNLLLIGWIALFCLLWSVVYTMGDIPLWSAPSLMTESEKDRNRLYSMMRVVAGVAGGVTMLGALPIAQAVSDYLRDNAFGGDLVRGERMGFLAVAAGFTLAGCAMFQLAGIKMKERIAPSGERGSVLGSFKMMWDNRPFRQVLLSGILGSTKNTVMIVALPLVNYYFAGKDPAKALLYIALLGGGLMAGMLAGQAFTPRWTEKFEKKTLYNFSNYAGAPTLLALFALYWTAPGHDVTGMGYVAVFSALLALYGAFNGVNIVVQTLMIGDAVDLAEFGTGIRPDGVFFSGQTFLAKLTTGIATIVSGLGYALVGFSDAKIAELNQLIAGGVTGPALRGAMPEYDGFMTLLFFLMTIPPAVGCLLAVLPTRKYAMSNGEHRRLLAQLNERRHAKEESIV